jgi:hypothetical protein
MKTTTLLAFALCLWGTVANAECDQRYLLTCDVRDNLALYPAQLVKSDLQNVVPALAQKAREIISTCGSNVISSVRHTRVAGTRRISLHASGRAVDLRGNYRCIYSLLGNWPGGYSTDYRRVKHVHVSYDPHGREWGARFVHKRRHVARMN